MSAIVAYLLIPLEVLCTFAALQVRQKNVVVFLIIISYTNVIPKSPCFRIFT